MRGTNKISVRVLIPLLAILSLFSSCARDGCEELQEMPVSFTRYWLANEGSWWVYKSSDTTSLNDTAKVDEIVEITNTTDDSDPDYCHHIKVPRIKHTNFNMFNDSITAYSPHNSGLGTYNLFLLGINWSSPVSNPCLMYPPEIGFVMNDWSFLEITDLNLANFSFINVWHLLNVVDSSQVYLAPDAGLVKFVKPGGSEWEVIDYYIQ